MYRPDPIRDRLGVANPAEIRGPAFAIIDRLQHMDPSVQLTATAVALCAMCEALGVDMRYAINVAENTLRDSEGPFTTHIQAIREYAKGEILRHGR